MLEQFLRYLKLWEESVMMLRSPSVLAPFVMFAAFQFVVLVCLGLFSVPPLSAVMVPVVERLGGEEALHYPAHMVMLPRLYQQMYIPLAVLLGFVLFGWGVALMLDHLERTGVEVRRQSSFRFWTRAPSLMVVGFVFVAGLMAIQLATAYASSVFGNPKLGMLVSVARVAALVAFQSLIIYAVYYVVTGARNPFAALTQSVRFGRSNIVITAMLVFTVFLVHWPLDYLTGQADRVVLKFNPELVFMLMAAGIIVEIATNFFLFASTTAVAAGVKRDGI